MYRRGNQSVRSHIDHFVLEWTTWHAQNSGIHSQKSDSNYYFPGASLTRVFLEWQDDDSTVEHGCCSGKMIMMGIQ